MKLYILRRRPGFEADYEQNCGIIVRAINTDQARIFAENADNNPIGIWLDPECSTCYRLEAEGPAGIILRDNRGA